MNGVHCQHNNCVSTDFKDYLIFRDVLNKIVTILIIIYALRLHQMIKGTSKSADLNSLNMKTSIYTASCLKFKAQPL